MPAHSNVEGLHDCGVQGNFVCRCIGLRCGGNLPGADSEHFGSRRRRAWRRPRTPWGGWGGGYAGGDTYIDNSDSRNVTGSQPNTAGGSGASGLATNSGPPEKLPVENWPELGIKTFTGHNGNQSGLVVVHVTPDSAAQRAGLVRGDVILNFDGQSTPDEDSLEDVLDSAHGNFTALVVDATTGKERTLHGQLPETERRNESVVE